MPKSSVPAAVAFDLDGVLVDTEPLWAEAKHAIVRESGGRWRADAPTAMLGMSGPEWSGYMHEALAVPLAVDEIGRRVVEQMLRRLGSGVPALPGAREAVEAIAARWPLALASSADRPVIEAVLAATGLDGFFQVVVSSGEAGRGKPAPDVYLAAADRLGFEPTSMVAVEDSRNGMRSARDAGMGVVAIVNPSTPVDDAALAAADVVLHSATELTPQVIEDALSPC
jgi:HAD superfamily hydrolase (TIGR01509 family)